MPQKGSHKRYGLNTNVEIRQTNFVREAEKLIFKDRKYLFLSEMTKKQESQETEQICQPNKEKCGGIL